MIIEEVDIEDFRSHRKSRVTFDEGISVIVGENGSGKTSILDAVNYALFKSKPNKDINADDLIRIGREEAVVSVRFHQNGRVYRVKRGRRKGRATGSMFYQVIDGREVIRAKGEGEITKEVEAVLGITGELFGKAIYIKQGELDTLISAPPSSRKEIVGKLLGAHDLETAHKNMQEIIREYKNRAERLWSVGEDIKKKKEQIKETEEEIRVLETKLKTIIRDMDIKHDAILEKEKLVAEIEALKDLETKKRERAVELANYQEKVRDIEEYEKVMKITREAADRFVKIEKEIDAIKDDKNRLYKLKEREKNLDRELHKVSQKHESLVISVGEAFKRYSTFFKTEIRDYSTLADITNTTLKNLETRLKEQNQKKEDLSQELNELSGQNSEIEKAVTELIGAGKRCPVCKNPLTPGRKEGLLEEYRSKINENKKRIDKIRSDIEKIVQDEKDIDVLLNEVRDINLKVIENNIKALSDAEKQAERLKTDLDENARGLMELKGLEKRLSEKEREKTRLETGYRRYIEAQGYLRKNLPEKERFLKRCETLIEDIKDIENRIEKKRLKVSSSYRGIDLQSVPELLKRARDELKKQREDLLHLRDEKTRSESRIMIGRQAARKLNNELVELKEKEKEKEKLEKFVEFLGRVRNLFHKDQLQKELRINSKPIVERYTREVFDRFDLPYSDIELTDDFGMVVYCADGEESVDMLSGGEKIAAALALRIGIARAISGPSMELIILDEPTIHLDTLRRQELVNIIKKLFTIPQTIVVTHDKEFENAADTLITVEKVGGVSKVRYENE